MHADWCPACQKMEPTYLDLQAELTTDKLLFFRFDLTDDQTKKQSLIKAGELGITKVLSDIRGTGFLVIIDAQTKEKLKVFTNSDNKETIVGYIENKR
ncbi:MAG: hypothetical protein HC896_05215 [Bacteroidales bacterium]|nr:hypothetical protein [Bacteroidales bacterium]